MSASVLDVTLLSLCTGYTVYNAIRKTLPIALPLLMIDLGLSKSEVGLIASNFALAYGCSKFGSSVISDHIDCKHLFIIGLLCTSLTSLLFPFVGNSVGVLSAVWFVNGLVQGVGWPSFSKIIYLSYSAQQRGSAWSAASTAGNIGLILGSAAFPSLLQYGWRAPFVLSGVIGVVTALVIYITVPNVTIADEVVSKSSTSNVVKHSVDENGVLAKLKVLLSIPLCCLFVGSMCSFFMQRGLADWAGLFFIEKYHMDAGTANYLVFVSEVGGVAGSLASGVVSDMRIVNYRKDLTCLLFSLLLLPVYLILAMALADRQVEHTVEMLPSMYLLLGCMLLVGVGASGPKTLIGLMVRDSVPVQHMGLAGGVLGFVGQIGGALAGRGIGSMLEVFGWRSFFPSLLGVAAVCSSVIVIFMWNLRVSKDRISKSE